MDVARLLLTRRWIVCCQTLVLLVVLPLLSCGKPAGPFVTLLLSNFPPETKAVVLKVSVGNEVKSQSFVDNDTLSLVTVEFPVGTRGEATFEAETRLAGEQVRARQRQANGQKSRHRARNDLVDARRGEVRQLLQ